MCMFVLEVVQLVLCEFENDGSIFCVHPHEAAMEVSRQKGSDDIFIYI